MKTVKVSVTDAELKSIIHVFDSVNYCDETSVYKKDCRTVLKFIEKVKKAKLTSEAKTRKAASNEN